MIHLLLLVNLYTLPPKALTWDMFKAPPNTIEVAKGYRASTHTQWALTDSFDNGKVWFSLESKFMEDLSWTVTDCPVALSHETTHYYISEIWATICRKRLSKYQGCPESKLKKSREIYQHCWNQSRKLQALFDRESKHGTNLVLERIWERNIARDVK